MPRKQDGPRSQYTATVYLNEEEWITISRKAKASGTSLSCYMRKASLGRKLLSLTDLRTVHELRHLRADLARLGNLFKGYRFGQERVGDSPEDILKDLDAKNRVLTAFIVELTERLFGKNK